MSCLPFDRSRRARAAGFASFLTTVVFFVCGCLRAFGQAAAPAANSLVYDAGFEQSTTGTLSGIWSSTASSTLVVAQYYAAKSGTKYLEVDGSPGNVSVQAAIGAYTDASGNHALVHGRSYYVGAWVGVANSNEQKVTLKVERKNQAGAYYTDFEAPLSFKGTGNANQKIGWHHVHGVYHFEDNEGMMNASDASTVRLSLSVNATSVFFVDQVELYEQRPDSIMSDGRAVLDDPGFSAGALRILGTNSDWTTTAGYFDLNPGATGDAPNTFTSDANGLICSNTFLKRTRYIAYGPNLSTSPYDWRYYKTTVEMEWPASLGYYEVLIRGTAYKLSIDAASGYAQLRSISGKATTLAYATGTFAAGTVYEIVFDLEPKTVGGTTYDNLSISIKAGATTVLTLAFDASNPDFSCFSYLGQTTGGGVALGMSGTASPQTRSVTVEDASGVYASWDFKTTNTSSWNGDWLPGALSTTSAPAQTLAGLVSFDPGLKIIYAYKLDQTLVGNAVPIGQTQAEIDKRASVKAAILALLDAMGDNISVFEVDNETVSTFPTSQNTTTETGDDYVRSVEWLKIVAGWVNDWRHGTGGNPNLRISTGAIIVNPSFYTDLSPNTSDPYLIHASDMLRWANDDPNVDYIDVHFYPTDKRDLENALAWVRLRAEKPVICTEWSQQGGAYDFMYNVGDTSANGTKLLDATFRNQSVLYAAGLITSGATNADYVEAAYKNPVPQSEFNAFVQLAIDDGYLSTDLIQDAFDTFNEEGIVYPCYAMHTQYSSARGLTDLQASFNMLEMWGTLAVQGVPVTGAENTLQYQPIAGFRSEWQAASSRVLPGDLLTEHRFDDAGDTLQTAGSGTHAISGGTYNINTLSGGSLYAWDNGFVKDSVRVEAVLSLNSYNASSSGVGVFAKRDATTGDRYALVYRMYTGQLALSVTHGGTTTDLALQAYSGLLSHPAHFMLEVAEPVIRGYVDHVLVFQVTDSTLAGQSGTAGIFGFGADFAADVLKLHQGRAVEDVDYGVTPNYTWASHGSGTWTINTSGQFEQTVGQAGTAFQSMDWSGAQADYRFDAQVRPLATANGGSVGLVARYNSSDNSRYEFVYQPAAKRLALRRCDHSGVQTLLRTMDMTGREAVDGHDYAMSVEVVGPQIKAYWEGFLVFSYYDDAANAVTSGLPGLHTYLSRGAFDAITVEGR